MVIIGAQATVSRYLMDSELGEVARRVHSDVTVRVVGHKQVRVWEWERTPRSCHCSQGNSLRIRRHQKMIIPIRQRTVLPALEGSEAANLINHWLVYIGQRRGGGNRNKVSILNTK